MSTVESKPNRLQPTWVIVSCLPVVSTSVFGVEEEMGTRRRTHRLLGAHCAGCTGSRSEEKRRRDE